MSFSTVWLLENREYGLDQRPGTCFKEERKEGRKKKKDTINFFFLKKNKRGFARSDRKKKELNKLKNFGEKVKFKKTEKNVNAV